jgi:hypothetical protein
LPGGSPTAKAIRYALNHRDGLERFLDDGRAEIDSNTVERAIRPLVLSRKNALFASGDDGGRRWADLASLIETCKLNGVNPQGNRVKLSGVKEACEEVVIPSGSFAPAAH